MRKSILLSFLLLYKGIFVFALKDCSELEDQYEDIKNEVRSSLETWELIPADSSQKATFSESLSLLLSKGEKLESDYNQCVSSVVETNKLIATYFDT